MLELPKYVVSFLALPLACMLLSNSPAYSELLPSNDPELLDVVLKQQKGATEAIERISCEYTYRIEQTREAQFDVTGQLSASGGREVRTGKGIIWLRGDHCREVQEFQIEYPERGALKMEKLEKISTPTRYIHYVGSMHHVFFTHVDPAVPLSPAIERNRKLIPFPNPFAYGLGDEDRRDLLEAFSDRHKSYPGNFEWIISGGGAEPYTIEVFGLQNGQRWKDLEITIDQHHGFLTTKSSTYDPLGALTHRYEITPKLAGKHWVPGKIVAWEDDDNESTEILLGETKIGEAIEDKVFELSGLNASPETFILQEYDLDGSHLTKVWHENAWLPEKAWTQDVRDKVDNLLRSMSVSPDGAAGIWKKGGAF